MRAAVRAGASACLQSLGVLAPVEFRHLCSAHPPALPSSAPLLLAPRPLATRLPVYFPTLSPAPFTFLSLPLCAFRCCFRCQSA